MKSIGRKGKRAKAGKSVFVAINLLFPPAIASATVHHAGRQQNRTGAGKSSAATGSGRKQRVALPFRTEKVQENQGSPDIHLGQDDLLVILPDKGDKIRNFSFITHFITHV